MVRISWQWPKLYWVRGEVWYRLPHCFWKLLSDYCHFETRNHIGDTNEKVFTDDDFKRLREDCQKDFTGIYEYQQKVILAFLFRLEAAENSRALYVWRSGHECCEKECAVCLADKAWRQAAGK